MQRTNLSHRAISGLPKTYTVFFSNAVVLELERICSLNLCNTTIRPYRRWLKLFYATVEWIGDIDKWLSMLSYGYVFGSVRLPNHTFIHTCGLGSITYHFIRQDGDIAVMCDHISLNPFVYKGTTIFMETLHKNHIILKESQLHQIIRVTIQRILTSA